jgi:hypothetical protein
MDAPKEVTLGPIVPSTDVTNEKGLFIVSVQGEIAPLPDVNRCGSSRPETRTEFLGPPFQTVRLCSTRRPVPGMVMPARASYPPMTTVDPQIRVAPMLAKPTANSNRCRLSPGTSSGVP